MWAFSKSEIKHGFHIIILITQRMAAVNKVKVKMIKRLPRARVKPNTKGQGQKLRARARAKARARARARARAKP